MGGMMSMLRMFSARLKTTVGGPPESMRKMEAAEASAPPLPAANLSWWVASTRDQAAKVPTSNEPLSDVDVCVLGGGIVGITTAYLLRKQGLKARCACARARSARSDAQRIALRGASRMLARVAATRAEWHVVRCAFAGGLARVRSAVRGRDGAHHGQADVAARPELRAADEKGAQWRCWAE
jgi:hypothetical protein